MSVFTTHHSELSRLIKTSTKLKDLGSVIALLAWDQETFLPPKGALARARQLETLSGIYHDHATAKSLGTLIRKLDEAVILAPEKFSLYDIALIREMARDYKLATKLPKNLVSQISKASSMGLEAWKHARRQNDFSLFAPSLEHMVALKREVAGYLGYQASPYDALLHEYEDGLTKKHVYETFTTLKRELEVLIPRLTKKTASYQHHLFSVPYDEKKLWELSMKLLTQLGFDLQRGRQNESTHPFTIGLDTSDVRLTTRVLTRNPISTLMSSIHEGGHGMYEQGVLPEISSTTLGNINSLVIHESQSRFYENMVGKSRAFWKYFFPVMQSVFPEHLLNASEKQAWEEVNFVCPSPIRVDADEATYHMHIIIRTEIECELIEGTLKVKDLKERWNSDYQKILGVKVPDDTTGVLQDIHWSQGLIGYFPTYSLGSMLSCQLEQAFKKAVPDYKDDLARGNFESTHKWLAKNIHEHGRFYSSLEICKNVTGRKLSPLPFLDYIRDKFEVC